MGSAFKVQGSKLFITGEEVSYGKIIQKNSSKIMREILIKLGWHVEFSLGSLPMPTKRTLVGCAGDAEVPGRLYARHSQLLAIKLKPL
jgi:hypothetical protein